MLRTKVNFSVFCRLLLVGGFLCLGWCASSAAGPDTNYDEQKVPHYTLPELMPKATGTKSDLERWESGRRAEVLSLLEQHIYGRTPTASVKVQSELVEQSDDALDGIAIRRQFELTFSRQQASPKNRDASHLIRVQVLVYTPKAATGPVPAFLGLSFSGNQSVHSDAKILLSTQRMRAQGRQGVVGREGTEKTRGTGEQRWQAELLIQRGYGLVTVYCGDFCPDSPAQLDEGVLPLFYKPGQSERAADEWGAIGAWAWGLSQVRNWLTVDALVDAQKVVVIGHSRLGKAALWAGAQDSKFAMVISNNSGCGGAALYRRCYGERLHQMQRNFPHWFCKDHAQWAEREAELPVDQHMLLALVAPRPLYVASAEGDRWADPKGEFLSAQQASQIYQLYGKPGLSNKTMPAVNEPITGQIGYHLRTGNHNITRYDWQQYLDFADKHFSLSARGEDDKEKK